MCHFEHFWDHFRGPPKVVTLLYVSGTLGADNSKMSVFDHFLTHFDHFLTNFDRKCCSKSLLSVRGPIRKCSKVLKMSTFGTFCTAYLWLYPLWFKAPSEPISPKVSEMSLFSTKKWPFWIKSGTFWSKSATFRHFSVPAKNVQKDARFSAEISDFDRFDGYETVKITDFHCFCHFFEHFWTFLSYRARGCLLCRGCQPEMTEPQKVAKSVIFGENHWF